MMHAQPPLPATHALNERKGLLLVKSVVGWGRDYSDYIGQLFQEEAKQSEGEAGLQRKRHTALTQQVRELWNRARLFEKETELFEGRRRKSSSKGRHYLFL